jgi:hypothetical protein
MNLETIADPDGVYQRLVEAHEGLSEADSQALNARLILILINALGDRQAVLDAIDMAVEAGRPKAG